MRLTNTAIFDLLVSQLGPGTRAESLSHMRGHFSDPQTLKTNETKDVVKIINP